MEFNNNLISENDSLTLGIDGWDNTRNVEVLNIMVCVPESIYYKSIEVKAEKGDHFLIERDLTNVIEELGPNKISGIISDSGSPMVLAQKNLIEKYPHIIGVRCSAHVLNLLIGDICKLKTINDIILKSKSIVKEIIGSKLKKAQYDEFWLRYIEDEKQQNRNIVKISLALPVATRWYSIRNMISNLIRAEPVLQRMAIDINIHLNILNVKVIKDDEYWSKLKSIHKFLDPIIKGMQRHGY